MRQGEFCYEPVAPSRGVPRARGPESDPELVYRSVEVFSREGNIFKTAAERIVVAHIRPVDPHSGIDGRFDVFRLDIAAAGPAVIGAVGAGGVGRADRPAAAHARAGEYHRLLRIMVATARAG